MFVLRLRWCRRWRLRAGTEAGIRRPAPRSLRLMEHQRRGRRRGVQIDSLRLKRGPQVREEEWKLGAGVVGMARTMMEGDKRRRADGVIEIGTPPPPSPASPVLEAPHHT